MKKKSIYVAVLLLSVIVQTSAVPVFISHAMIVDNVLMLVIAWSLIDGFAAFLGWTIVAGILYDVVSYTTVGTHVLVFLAVTYMVSFFSRRFSMDMKGAGLALILLFVALISFVSHGVLALSISGDVRSFHDFGSYFGSFPNVVLQTALNMLLFFVWFGMIRKIKKYYSLDK
jgi:rod shape-determining protein MreD